MIKNRVGIALGGLLLAGLGSSCSSAAATPPDGYQGVIELDERVLAFEVGGRVERVESRAARDKVNAKVMNDPRMAAAMEGRKMPFDLKRMWVGGFASLVEFK